MPFHHRSQETGHDATEPLYRDSNDHAEKTHSIEHDNQARALQASIRRLRRWLIAVSVLLALICTYTLFTFRHTVQNRKTLSRGSFAPEMPQVFTTFDRNPLFASNSTPAGDEAWGNDLTPPGDGFVLIPNPQDYSLPPGQPTDEGEGEIYDISVFHQLHCLRHIRTFLLTLKAGVEYDTSVETYENMLRPQEDHVYHCFDYIRQALMCNADMTVEWPRTEEDGRRIAVDGWGVTHQCKNWDSVMDFMAGYKIPNAFGGGGGLA